jgi:hypothetical protein
VYADPGETFMGLSLTGGLDTPVVGRFPVVAPQPSHMA